MPRSWPRSTRRRTCTWVRSRSSWGRRRPTRTCSTTSARACTWCRATGRSSSSRDLWRADGKKLPSPPIGMGMPLWIDDPSFNLEYHIRHTALPDPGSEEQLRLLAGRIFSQRLDRSKPLWELWLVQGLERNRFALINKTHHSLVDGVSGVDITTVLFDTSPTPTPVGAESWTPNVEPSDAQLVAEGVKGLATLPVRA